MRSLPRLLLSGLGIAPGLLTAPLQAQQVDRPPSVLDFPDQQYRPYGVRLGKIMLYPEVVTRLEYDSNIYAKEANRIGDGKFVIMPAVSAQYQAGAVNVRADASATVRRMFKYRTENSTAALTNLQLGWQPSAATSVQASGGWRRIVEDRGDPEARAATDIGPRLINMYLTDLRLTQNFGRLDFDIRGAFQRLDHLSVLDLERDQDIFSASGRIRYRVSGLVGVFGQAFISRRDFKLGVDSSGINRDATTYGARGGIAIDPGGLIRGDMGVGIFRFDPTDPQVRARTGLSVDGSLIYQPTPRIAVTLDGFRGDVATLVRGASSRTDTRVQLGAQLEARHNLQLEAGVFYRLTKFVGTPVTQRILGVRGEVDYLITNRVSLGLDASYGNRNSDDATQDYKRIRAGVTFRLRF
ncbi:MAG TPA: outer membrane beta-barrel protein [Sphingobium sp.]